MYVKKVEYLKGLMDGLSIDTNTNEYKLFTAVIEALDAMSDALSDVEDDVTNLEDSIDDISDELDDIGDIFESLRDIADGENGTLHRFPGKMRGEDDDDEDDDDDAGEYEVTCPNCEHTFFVDEETIFKGKVTCPNCKNDMSFEIDGCDCGHCHGNCSHEDTEE